MTNFRRSTENDVVTSTTRFSISEIIDAHNMKVNVREHQAERAQPSHGSLDHQYHEHQQQEQPV